MTPIYDQNTVDKFVRLSVNSQFAVHQHESFGEVLSVIKEQQARKLAQKIQIEKKFFDLKIDSGYGTLRSSIIVMTDQELADLLREQFRKGVDHAQGFMPTWEINK